MKKKFLSFAVLMMLAMSLALPGWATDQRIQYTEELVGANHPTKTDTINRLSQIEHNTDGTHKHQALNPVGTVVAWLTETAPTGWLECSGAAISRTTYAALYAVIGTTYGVGDGSTTFNLPDFRGRFIRGWAHGQTTDPDKASRTDRGDGTTGDHVGTKQAYSVESHRHAINYQDSGTIGDYDVFLSGTSITGGSTGYEVAYGGNETRPINVNVMWIIKY
jgi:phage-related tail fiber protein